MVEPESTTIVLVRDLPIEARIGVNPDEQDRRQSLIVSVEVTLEPGSPSALADTVDYRAIAAEAQRLGNDHIGLIEDFARRLGRRCLDLGAVASASVSISKPEALAAGEAATLVRVARSTGAQILPFVRPRSSDRDWDLRFSFGRGINPEAQKVLARFLDQLAQSVDGLETTGFRFDPKTGQWGATLALSGSTGPQLQVSRADVGRTGEVAAKE